MEDLKTLLAYFKEHKKIYITGDLHGDLRRFQPEIFFEQEVLTKEDLVLVAGDFGCVWHGDERDDEGLDWLEGRPFTTAGVGRQGRDVPGEPPVLVEGGVAQRG